jgi:ABC-type multidrug transport system ATPase subunit
MIIETKGLRRTFGRLDALNDLNLEVPEGSVFALVGANGAGKTTTIKLLMNIIEPTSGSATVLGVDSRRLSPSEFAQIGYVSETQDMPARMTVAAYIAYLRPFYSSWDTRLEASLLDQFGLPPDRRIKDLSHGMRLKTALVCALPFRPKLLVLDEPFSGLDPLARDELLEGVLRRGIETTILISSHELAEIEALVTHVAFIDRGRLLFQEAIADLKARLRRVQVTFGANARLPTKIPTDWLDANVSGNVLTFVDTRFSEQDLAARLGVMIGDDVVRVDATPVPLRSIYTALARAVRDEQPDT